MPAGPFADLHSLARDLRTDLDTKKFVLIYAFNGTGKTRLSMAFKDVGRSGDDRDTLYFNAFTEDLFSWDNDLENDRERVLKLNKSSRFFAGLSELEMDNRIRPLLNRYADFDFRIDTAEWEVTFSREVLSGDTVVVADDIKVSRGEENIFIWCFFLAIVELAMDPEIEAYNWVKYVYIDDPISSLDEQNAIVVANHLAQLLLKTPNTLKTVISSHHILFFNVLCNELCKNKRAARYHLSKAADESYQIRNTENTPAFHHVASLRDLCIAAETGSLKTHHFNMMRTVMEKTASFHGYKNFSDCIHPDGNDPDRTMYQRVINIMSHGNYSLYEPVDMMEENKAIFRKILSDFLTHFSFNPEETSGMGVEATAA